jgi:hypothetical protein
VEFQKPTKETQFQLIETCFPQLNKQLILEALENFSFTGGQIYNIRKKFILQSVIEDSTIDSVFWSLCNEEIQKTETKRIGFN